MTICIVVICAVSWGVVVVVVVVRCVPGVLQVVVTPYLPVRGLARNTGTLQGVCHLIVGSECHTCATRPPCPPSPVPCPPLTCVHLPIKTAQCFPLFPFNLSLYTSAHFPPFSFTVPKFINVSLVEEEEKEKEEEEKEEDEEKAVMVPAVVEGKEK
ncbi:hypothetical protein O3P69_004767 [Scylla paramamosain]|uniref:Uncharacterized protein n=1 Tax=Scylla paramamosain TaxID=85552 RepID=A0AAW0UB05_SCYPA